MIKALLVVNLVIWLILIYERTPSPDLEQLTAQQELRHRANAEIGLPDIKQFAEMRTLKQIIEVRDRSPETISYLVDRDGHLHKFCDSIGYGIPSGTQYTNPFQEVNGAAIGEAEPFGLFPAPVNNGLWIMCRDPVNHTPTVVYVDHPIIVSPFPIATK
jgi:hypothetical protein